MLNLKVRDAADAPIELYLHQGAADGSQINLMAQKGEVKVCIAFIAQDGVLRGNNQASKLGFPIDDAGFVKMARGWHQ